MKNRIALFLMSLLLLGVGTGCEKAGQVKQLAEQASKAMEEAQATTSPDQAGEKMSEAFSGLRRLAGGGESVQAIDFRRLKTVLPEALPAMEREDVRGERGSRMGFSTSQVEGDYRASEGGQRVTIQIQDMGSMRGLTMLASDLSSLGATVDKASTSGYERTTTYRGYDAVEKYRKTDYSERARIGFVVAERFKVDAEGHGLSMERLKEALARVDWDALEGMKDEGVGVEDDTGERVAELYADARRSEMDAEQQPADARSPVQSVEAATLEAMLPAAAAGIAQSSATSQRNPMSDEFTITVAEAAYEADDRRITVKITDFGGAVGPGGMLPGYAWLLMDVNRESDRGYERTTEYRGFPAREKLERGGITRATMDVVVGQRFGLHVEGQGVSMDAVRETLAGIDVQALEALKDAPA